MSWEIDLPALSRGSVHRLETQPLAQVLASWPNSRVIAIGPGGSFDTDGSTPRWEPVPTSPPADRVYLGQSGGRHRWAISTPDPGAQTLREVGALVSADDAALLVAAVGLIGWHRAAPFCPACGERSTADPTGRSRHCPNEHQEFPRTDPAVIMLVDDGAGRMVLARQDNWPAGRHSVLAGFCESGESLEATVRRELAEEIGVQVDKVRYLGSQPWPFPRSLMIGFTARVAPGTPLVPNPGEIAAAVWVSRESVRALLADENPAEQAAQGISLPGSISIARRMIEAWARQDD